MKWQAVPHRSNKTDCFADVEGPRGTIHFLIRQTSGHGRDRCYVIRRNGNEIGREATLDKAKACAEAYSPDKQEGKAYALQAIKLAMMEIEVHDEQHGNTPPLDQSYHYLQCALDVLEGRVPRLAVLPEMKS